MSNPPLSIHVVASPGSEIGDCFDHARSIVDKTGAVVTFDFNGVHCGVRPCDDTPWSKEIFVRNFHRETARKTDCKICYANP